MSDAISRNKPVEMVQCYICLKDGEKAKSMEVPTTEGEVVWTHPNCLERYMKSAIERPAACGSCTGGAGCC